MNNFPVNVDGKEYWISRSVATVGFIFTKDNGFRILAVKRGKGCPDEVGKWCCPCGYLEWDETLAEGCAREIKEETNLTVNPNSLNFWSFHDDPKEPHQNITFRFVSFNKSYAGQTISPIGSEPDEVEDIEWIRFDELGKYDWAFGHLQLILDCIQECLFVYFNLMDNKTRLYLKSLTYTYDN